VLVATKIGKVYTKLISIIFVAILSRMKGLVPEHDITTADRPTRIPMMGVFSKNPPNNLTNLFVGLSL
jgi:hypothetical protein